MYVGATRGERLQGNIKEARIYHRPVDTLWLRSGSSQTKTPNAPTSVLLFPYSSARTHPKKLDWPACAPTLAGYPFLLTVPQSEIFGLTVCRHSFVARSHTLVKNGGARNKSR